MSFAKVLKEEMADYWDCIIRMDKELKTKQYKELKKWMNENKKRRAEWKS